MWGTEYVAAPPQQHQGNVSICNRYRVIGPLDVTDRDLSAAANLPSQSVTVTGPNSRQTLQIEIFSSPVVKRLNL